jgi:hypothetical protein
MNGGDLWVFKHGPIKYGLADVPPVRCALLDIAALSDRQLLLLALKRLRYTGSLPPLNFQRSRKRETRLDRQGKLGTSEK